MNMSSIMDFSSIMRFFTDNYLLTVVLALIVLGFGVRIVSFLHQQLDFYIWYFVSILIVLLWAVKSSHWDPDPKLEVDHMLYFYAFLLGMTTAFGEIIGKFSDEPIKSLRTPHALFYHLLNGSISAFALFTMKTFGQKPVNNQDKLELVLIAGLGAMFVMRSKLFNLKVGGQDVALGPEQLINIFFSFMEDAIDRVRAQSRIDFLRKLRLNEIHFDRLDEYCLSMLRSAQALSLEEIIKCRENIDQIRTREFRDPSLRSLELGFLMLNRMGEDFVSKVFANLPADWYVKAAMPEQQETTSGLFNKLAQLGGTTQTKPVYYMAYGTSMSGRAFRERLNWADMEETEFVTRCEPQRCVLQGYRLVFNKPHDPDAKDPAATYGMPNIEATTDKQNVVEGVLYKLTDATLRFIDRTEIGYVRKHDIEVLVGKELLKAEIYVAEGTRPNLKPETYCLQLMLEGARAFQLSESYIAQLESISDQAITLAPQATAAPAGITSPTPATVSGQALVANVGALASAAELVSATAAPSSTEASGNGTHPSSN